jgi:hypothetical protein
MKSKIFKLFTPFLCLLVATNLALVNSTVIIQQTTRLLVSPSTTIVPVSSNFAIYVRIEDVVNLFAFEIKLRYDTTVMDVADAQLCFPFNNWQIVYPVEVNEDEGYVIFRAMQITGTPFMGSGNIGVVNFQCTAPSQDSGLVLEDVMLTDIEGYPIICEIIHGTVTQYVPVHDVAVTSIAPAKTVVCQTMPLKIDVEVSNLGDVAETLNVTVNGVPSAGPPVTMGVQQVTLAPSETRVLTFIWIAPPVIILSTYTIEAIAETVPSEVNTVNNTFLDGEVNVTTLGDVNGDGIVNIKDAALIGRNWLLPVHLHPQMWTLTTTA